jgi:surface antigen/peptidoglycan hydrolase CwlO-like protein
MFKTRAESLMKQTSSHKNLRRRSSGFFTLLTAIVTVVAVSLVPTVWADQFDEQIRQLQAQNADKRSSLQLLAMEATSFQDAVNRLNAQIGALQAQIDANQAEQVKLQQQIEQAQAELDRQRRMLGADIKAMYVDGDPSTLEILASSRNLSDFVDKEEYRNAVQAKIQETLKRITKLQAELNTKKIAVDRLLAEQQAQRQQLDASRAEQNRLLTYNQQQQNEFNGQIKLNNSKISELRRQQVIANLALFGGGVQPGIPGGGGYPWGNAYCYWTNQVGGDCYNYDWYFSGSAWDPWGYGFRNCTSWVAYKLAADGKSGFSGLGNANTWPGRAQSRGIGVSYGNGARAGDAVVNANGFYGHVMYVEAVTDDGRIVVSDYNRAGDGLYRGPDGGNANVLSQAGLYFIHF